MRRTLLALVAVATPLYPARAATQAPVGPPIPPVNWPQSVSGSQEGGPSVLSRVGWGIGGAIVGAWLGYFSSQLAQGDWQDGKPIDRSLWAVVGGSVGLTLGAGFPLTGGGGGTGRSGLPVGRDHLGAQEMEGLGFDNAYQAVSSLRPEWLRTRGDRSLVAGTDPVRVGGAGGVVTVSGSTPLVPESMTIQIYLNYVNLGGTDQLRNVNARDIRHLYFFDTAAATLRFGGSHPHGAILIIV
jgi:hypothetical protein